MSGDRQTLDVYARMASDYAELVSRPEPDGDLRAFIVALPSGQEPVLDWGCGPGNSAAMMMAECIMIEATDASSQMAQLAGGLGVEVRVEPFEALEGAGHYRGIWANFSLLHAPRPQMADLLHRAARALVPSGVLHLGMKTGTGAARDDLGRLFTYWQPDEMAQATAAAGLTPLSERLGEGMGLDGRMEPYVIQLSRKPAI